MKPKRAEKKEMFSKIQFDLSNLLSINKLMDRVYEGLFRVYRMSSTHTAIEYLPGLLQCEKGHGNMERMVEEVEDSDYNRPHVFKLVIPAKE